MEKFWFFTVEKIEVCAFNYYAELPALLPIFLPCQNGKKDFG
jgi:hypothetical protein